MVSLMELKRNPNLDLSEVMDQEMKMEKRMMTMMLRAIIPLIRLTQIRLIVNKKSNREELEQRAK